MTGPKKTFKCKYCGEHFLRYQSAPRKYCSNECYYADLKIGNGNGPQRGKSFPIDLSIYEEKNGNIIIYDCGHDINDSWGADGIRHQHHFDYSCNLILSLCPSCHKRWHIELQKRKLAAQAAEA
jgi:hypothetical protein